MPFNIYLAPREVCCDGGNYCLTGHMGAPSFIRWIADVLWTLPAPTETWASIIGDLVWPGVAVFIVLRFRRFIRGFLNTLLERLKTDHIKTPFLELTRYELTPNSPVLVLDPDEAGESTDHFEPADIQRIEAIFSFIGSDEGWDKISDWLNKNFAQTLDIEDFVTSPEYASERERAFNDIEGLQI